LEDEASDRWEAEREVEKEILEASIATFVGTVIAVIGGGEDGEIDRAMLDHSGDQKRKALEASEVALQALGEGLKKFEIKHPNFGGPSASQPFSKKNTANQQISR